MAVYCGCMGLQLVISRRNWYGNDMTIQRKQARRIGTDGNPLSCETGTVIKRWGGKIPVCIVFPNSYHVGMSNLATHLLYKGLNDMDDVVCERCFFSDGETPLSVESKKPLAAFDIIFFTLSFELDFINIPRMLAASSMHVSASGRTDKEPLVVAGGICVMSNPEPLHDFFDLFMTGDIEPTMTPFMDAYRELRGEKRRAVTDALSRFEWVYDPQALSVSYNNDGTLDSFSPHNFAVTISRQEKNNLGSSAIIAEDTEFSNMFLIEGTRGCPSRCPFCLLGNLYDFVYDRIDPQ